MPRLQRGINGYINMIYTIKCLQQYTSKKIFQLNVSNTSKQETRADINRQTQNRKLEQQS